MESGRNQRGKGRVTPGTRPVSEKARIDIAKIISDFQGGNEQGMNS